MTSSKRVGESNTLDLLVVMTNLYEVSMDPDRSLRLLENLPVIPYVSPDTLQRDDPKSLCGNPLDVYIELTKCLKQYFEEKSLQTQGQIKFGFGFPKKDNDLNDYLSYCSYSVIQLDPKSGYSGGWKLMRSYVDQLIPDREITVQAIEYDCLLRFKIFATDGYRAELSTNMFIEFSQDETDRFVEHGITGLKFRKREEDETYEPSTLVSPLIVHNLIYYVSLTKERRISKPIHKNINGG